MKRSRRLALIAAGCLPFSMGALQQALAKGNLPVMQGFNTLKGDVRRNGQPASVGMAVNIGDTVVTGADSEALFVIGDNAFVLRARSTLRVEGSSSVKLAMRVVSGALASVFAKGEHQLIVRSATVGIRGTAAYLDTTQRDTYFCLCYGSAVLTPTAAAAVPSELTTRHHDRPLYIADNGTLRPAPVIGHTDAELSFLEGLFGRRPPYEGPGYVPRS